MIHRQILACLLLILIPLSAKAFPPASPAGGNYLVLDGDDDHAVLDFETFGRPLPNGTEGVHRRSMGISNHTARQQGHVIDDTPSTGAYAHRER